MSISVAPLVSPRRFGAVVAIAISAAALTASGASADVSSVYAPAQQARDFAAGQGGWGESSSFESCEEGVSCANVTNSFEPTGGAGADGHIRSAFDTPLTVLGSSTAIWQSPQFTYVGAAGEAPDSVSFAMARRADVGDLLGAGATATYSVSLIDVTGGGEIVIPLIVAAALEGADAWTAVAPVALPSSQLTSGNEYAIRISSRYSPGVAGVLVSGSADYDNVVLTATRSDSREAGDSGGPGGGDGSGGPGGAGGSTGSVSLLSLLRGAPTGPALLRGKRLFVKVSCPRRIGRACRITAQGLLGKGRPATAKRTVKLGRGKGRRIALRVRPKLRSRVAKRKRLLIRERVRAGKVRATVYKRRKLIRR